jgi:tetratricopeptide (TPR) repeat protein
MIKRPSLASILLLFMVSSFLTFRPSQVFAETGKGIELYNAWDFQKAETALREVLQSNPRDVEASYYLGLSVLQLGKHSEALGIFQKVKETQDSAGRPARSPVPDEFQIQMALARTRLELKQLPEAWTNLEAAAKLRADSADVHAWRGYYYLQQENLKQALKELDKAMELDAQNAYAHYYAGHVYLRQGNPARAVDMFKEFLQLAPLAPEAVKAKALIDALC